VSTVHIRPGTAADAPLVLFDEAVTWLVALVLGVRPPHVEPIGQPER
jgi:hypothetical protein